MADDDPTRTTAIVEGADGEERAPSPDYPWYVSDLSLGEQKLLARVPPRFEVRSVLGRRITSYNVCYTKLLRGICLETDSYKETAAQVNPASSMHYPWAGRGRP